MTSTLFLRLALPAFLVPALAATVLPPEIARPYVSFLQPVILYGTAVLAVWVSRAYRGELQRVFIFLASFLAIYGITNTGPVMEVLGKAAPAQFPEIVLALQLANYAVLLLACLHILRVVQVQRLDWWGWLVMVPVALGALYIVSAALFPSLASLQGIFAGRWASWEDAFRDSLLDEVGSLSIPFITYVLVRIFDAAVLLMLVPVLLLYLQYSRAQHQESLTFSVVVFGVTASLAFVYVYEFASQDSLILIVQRDFRQGSLLDALYIFGYLIIAAGLYAHRKHQEWSLRALERLLRF